MCELRKPLDKLTSEASRQAADLGNKIGWQGLEEEGKRNTENPGHAYGQAAKYTAMYYLGGLLGGAGGAGGAGATAAESAIPAATDTAITTAADEATQQAIREALIRAAAEGQDVGYVPEVHGLLTGTASPAPGAEAGLLNQGGKSAMQKFAIRQGANMMQTQQTPQAQPMRFQQPEQQQPQTPIYAGDEEMRRKLRALGYQV